jgi:hypothetical protein
MRSEEDIRAELTYLKKVYEDDRIRPTNGVKLWERANNNRLVAIDFLEWVLEEYP